MSNNTAMSLHYQWTTTTASQALTLAPVRGTSGSPYHFGEPPHTLAIDLPDFWIGVVPVTQALWAHVMGEDANPAVHRGPTLPLENVSWNVLHDAHGFLARINASPIARDQWRQAGRLLTLRLPTETEWEYAARGGPQWRDGFAYSGSNDVHAVAWHNRTHGDWTQPVATKSPNQLGLFDMSGNVWEWCRDVYGDDVASIPRDGTPYLGLGDERVLRGGCFHNWAMHCTVSKRYAIGADFHDGCIGFRLVAGY